MIKLNRSAICAIACVLMVGAFVVTATADLNDGLVSWWSFEGGGGADGAGDNDGTKINAPEVVAGYSGDGLSFNGVDQYVMVPDSASLQIPGDLTVTGWMWVRTGNNHAAICWKGQGIGWGPRFSWRVATTSNTNMTWGRTTGNANFEGSEDWFATDNVITTNEWIHVALTSSSADGQNAYVNGEDVTGVSAQTGVNATGPFGTFVGYPVEIGVGRRVGGTDGNDSYFDGVLDEIGIYNRTLSADEVAELAAGDMPTAVEAKGKLSTTWADIKAAR